MTPPVDRNLLRTLAGLARLHLPAEREETATARLQAIVDAFAAIASVPTEGVEASSYPMPLPTAWREDVAATPLPVEVVTANTRHSVVGAFVVPRVVEG
jgi:aspartyl/glutamyl-tRNA(Asn/Gln) amidotransferase C subunit